MIKPEDISESTRREIVRAINNADRDFESEVAAIANVLIESGVVSPPCKVKRDRDGTLDIDPSCGEIKVWIGKPVLSIYEHYRGQTE